MRALHIYVVTDEWTQMVFIGHEKGSYGQTWKTTNA